MNDSSMWIFWIACVSATIELSMSASMSSVILDSQLRRLKSRAEQQYNIRRQTAWQQCSNQPQSLVSQVHQKNLDLDIDSDVTGDSATRGRRATGNGRNKDTAVFLDRTRGQLNPAEHAKLPDHQFTVSLWCKPIGGQDSPAVILESQNLCQPFPNRGWTLGIHGLETSGERDLKFFFKMHSWSKQESSKLTSPLLMSTQWTHVGVTFDGTYLILYLNGAQVALTSDQASSALGGITCTNLWLGGDNEHHFRGQLDDLRIWDVALGSGELKMAMEKVLPTSLPRPKLTEDFSRLEGWDWPTEGPRQSYNLPRLVSSDVFKTHTLLQLKPHPCALTICDYPEIQKSYRDQDQLRMSKVLRYRVVVLSNNDGSNPTVTKEQIRLQHTYLQKAFDRYNITWELEELVIRNSILRTKTVLLSCYASMVGNGQCDPECRHPSTGNDGGDCGPTTVFKKRNDLRYDTMDEHDISECSLNMLGDGICDESCNVAQHKWDGGDCCSSIDHDLASLCHDPTSPYRSFMHIKELKSFLKLRNTRHINVLFAQWSNRDILGVATFPWEKDVFTEFGGVVLQPSGYGTLGHMSTLVHELGHVLGLWHVHRGVSEMDCTHSCYEKEASPVHGDLCSDTNPTPENLHCQDPPSGTLEVCGRSQFQDTPFANFMGYADDSCVQEFTTDQVARMHCYVDLVYSSSMRKKQRDHLPSPPLLLSAVSSTMSSVTLSWIPSLSTDSFYDTNVCRFCSESLEYSQFAYKAESSRESPISEGVWTPDEVIGAPDAELCILSYKIWLPDSEYCPNSICSLTVHFQIPAIPSLLELWITWNAHNNLKDIEIIFEDGTSDTISNLPAQCDTPLSIPVFYNKPMSKFTIRASHRFVGIDAVRMVSIPNNPQCSPCKPVRYRIWRDPSFSSGATKEADNNLFTDTDLLPKEKYTYKVQSWLGSRVTEFSPPFYFILESEVCGDGIVDKSEACDDGNTQNGDGCSSVCQIESSFHCRREPSLCYWHEGDGQCESFEEESSTSDCGFYTPDGFTDQWSNSLQTGPGEPPESCSPDIVAGPPILPLSCHSEQFSEVAWTPCDFQSSFWLLVRFPVPVVATSVLFYLASDGSSSSSPFLGTSKTQLQLLDVEGKVHHRQSFKFSCDSIPQKVAIVKDMSQPFAKTAAVNISSTNVQVALAAIQLRSSNILSPVDIDQCQAGELYHPGLKECQGYCPLPLCPEPYSKNAMVNCTGHQDGDVCNISCTIGHIGQRVTKPMVCQAGTWKGQDPNCKPIDCGIPLLPHADAMCSDGTTFGKMCSYKCRPPARFSGTVSGLATVTCKENGQWSMPNFACQLSCNPPLPPAHTVLASSKCRKMENFLFGQTCRFRCKGGYHVEGYGMRKRTLYLHCDDKASWSGPECVPVTCPIAQSGQHNCTASNMVGSECTVLCKDSKQTLTQPTVHTCGLDGSWNPELPQCYSNVECAVPVARDSDVQFSCEGGKIGSICKTTCINAEEQTIHPTNTAEKVRIICQSNGEWEPDPEEIQCEKKCVLNFIGDGYCDGQNNRLHCNWDGGDCCESTAQSTVRVFPRDCGENCSCKDPEAIENINPIR